MMRVPNITTYSNATYQLGKITSKMRDANEVVATQKRINSISDDPIGLSQVLDLKVSLENLDQIEKNVAMGLSWLKGGETALDSVNDLMLEVKTRVSGLVNASSTIDERNDTINSINGIMKQIVTLGNTQVNGNYIFGGTRTDVEPFKYDTDTNPPTISYVGNDNPFEIKTDKNADVQVGRAGTEVFWDDFVAVGSTNNTIVFKEDNGHGSASEKMLTVTIPDGEYNASDFEVLVKNALNKASSEEGYGVNYEVEYDGDEKTFSIREDGSYNGYMRTEFMWKTGGDPHLKDIRTIGQITPDDIDVSVVNKDALTVGTPEPAGSKPFMLLWDGQGNWKVQNNPGYDIPSTIQGSADGVDLDLDGNGVADISIKLDNPVSTKGESVQFEIVPFKGNHSLGPEIGFNAENSIAAPPVSDTYPKYITELIITNGVNDTIQFNEIDSTGVAPGVTHTATINPGTYTDMDALAKEIEAQMEAESLAGPNNIDYAVSYDPENSRFNIREDGTSLNELNVLWSASSATSTLGFYPKDDAITYPVSNGAVEFDITIDDTNSIMAFEEINGGVTRKLNAVVPKGSYKTAADLEAAVETAMINVSAASGFSTNYDLTYDPAAHNFGIQETGGMLTGFNFLRETGSGLTPDPSIAETLGFTASAYGGGIGVPYFSDTPPVLMTFGADNNKIDFQETNIDGTRSGQQTIEIPPGDYTDLDDVAREIEKAMGMASPYGVKYSVSYDTTADKFMIKGSDASIKSFTLLWGSGENADQDVGEKLGFYGDDKVSFSESDEQVVNIEIGNGINDKINFKEITKADMGVEVGELTASIKAKTYTSLSELGQEVEKALEAESRENGNRIDYSVTWDSYTKKFAIKENGTELEEFQLQWQTGDNAPLSEGGDGKSIGTILGFDSLDDVETPVESSRKVEWGIFNTLNDMNEYLAANDVEGLERTLGRLETNYDNMTSRIVDVGVKYKRLEIRNTMTTEVNLSLTERRSNIEDADIVEAIMNLKSIETAYEASLSSTAKIMKMSLVDYL
ncbi:MAG: flagellar hook-associated protein 3 [Desulfobacteraceae bacterium]|nr:flagellar hook-associated protein 3 [Desulfobacteraceae bacterium]